MLRAQGASLAYGERVLWSDLDVELREGEILAVLGANGAGKSSFIRAALGQVPLRAGSLEFLNSPVRRGDRRVGYVPQQTLAERETPLRGRDLVALGIDGHRWGIPFPRRARREAVDALVSSVHGKATQRTRLGLLSGGEQQRLRMAQALAGEPRLLLLDEPLLSLDLAHQRTLCDLVDAARQEHPLGVVFVTHDINPILDKVDRVMYFANGAVRVGHPDEVLRSDVLSELYRAPIDVIRARGRIIVAGAPEGTHHAQDGAA